MCTHDEHIAATSSELVQAHSAHVQTLAEQLHIPVSTAKSAKDLEKQLDWI